MSEMSSISESKRITVKPTEEQFSLLLEIKDRDEYSNFSIIVDTFELTNDQRLTLMDTDTNNPTRDLDFCIYQASGLGRTIQTFSEFDKLMNVLERKSRLVRSEDFRGIFELSNTLIYNFTGNKLTSSFNDIDRVFRKIRDTFRPIIEEKMEDLSKRGDGSLTYFNPVRAADSNKHLTLQEFDEMLISRVLRISRKYNFEPSESFYEEFNSLFPVDELIEYYKKHNGNITFSERIKNLLCKKCENVILDIFGNCGKLINVQINFDADSIVLFKEMTDMDYASEAEEYKRTSY